MQNSSMFGIKNFRWLNNNAPAENRKAALLIPQYNESSNCNFRKRLAYFEELAAQHSTVLDIIIIDDGSSDGSLVELSAFMKESDRSVYAAAVFPNGNKVGALYATILAISHEFIIFSDFDTDISGLDRLPEALAGLKKDESMMGGYFRMLPHEGKGAVFSFQYLEYSLLRTLYKYHQKDQSVPIMPGAGCCYKRNIIISIYQKHSGMRNGEDREATLLGLKMGYKAKYINNIRTFTRPPASLKNLMKQRTRWYLGYLETLFKERLYYWNEIAKRSAIGVRTILDLCTVLFILLIIPFLLCAVIINPQLALMTFSTVYGLYIIGSIYLVISYPAETGKVTLQTMGTILLFPAIKLCLEFYSWVKALQRFSKKTPQNNAPASQYMTDIFIYQQAARHTEVMIGKLAV